MTNGISRRNLITGAAIASFALGCGMDAQSFAAHSKKGHPVNNQASSQARKLFDYLHNIPAGYMVSGQTDHDSAEWVFQNTQKYPAILGCDFMSSTKQMGSDMRGVEEALDWWCNKHGLITFQWHWVSPTGAKSLGSGFYTNNTSFNVQTVMANQSSSDYYALIADIDQVASQLKILAQAQVPVLMRPLHEAQGGWFWWGAKGAQPCVELYHLIYERFTNVHKLNNLLWVWVAYPLSQGKGDPKDWYPGNDYVDFVASDYCEKAQDFADLLSLSGASKPVVLAETMNAPDPDAATGNATPWTYWVTWARRDWNKNSNGDMIKAMANPKTISLSDLPDTTRW